jgi:hypothetical protein
MNKGKVVRAWGAAAAVIAAGAGVAAIGALVWCGAPSAARAQSLPAVSVQWQPQTLLETRVVAKVIEDGKLLKAELDKLARKPGVPDNEYKKAWKERFRDTHLSDPRFWTGSGWKQGWEDALEDIYGRVKDSPAVSIDALSAVIEYKEYAGNDKDQDIDAIIRIRVVFSASPGDNILEGELCHRRICEIVPCGKGR